MKIQHRSSHRWLISVVLLFAMMLACDIKAIPTETPTPNLPVKKPVEPTKQPTQTLTVSAGGAPGTIKSTATGEGRVQDPKITPLPVLNFSPEDCTCAGLGQDATDTRYGGSQLECVYAFSGQYIDDNRISLEIETFQPDKLKREYEEWRSTWEGYANQPIQPEHEQIILVEDQDRFAYFVTGPGGGSSKTNTEIPMCGHGNGIYRMSANTMISLRFFACDLGETQGVYVRAMESLQACALAAYQNAVSRP